MKNRIVELEIPQRIILNLFDNKPKRVGTMARELKRTESMGKLGEYCNIFNKLGVLKKKDGSYTLDYQGLAQEMCNLSIKPSVGVGFKRMPNKKEMKILIQLLKTEFYKFYITTFFKENINQLRHKAFSKILNLKQIPRTGRIKSTDWFLNILSQVSLVRKPLTTKEGIEELLKLLHIHKCPRIDYKTEGEIIIKMSDTFRKLDVLYK